MESQLSKEQIMRKLGFVRVGDKYIISLTSALEVRELDLATHEETIGLCISAKKALIEILSDHTRDIGQKMMQLDAITEAMRNGQSFNQ